MLILYVCCTAHTSLLHAVILFGMHNQLLLLYMDAPLFTVLLFLEVDLVFYLYFSAMREN